MTTVNQPLDTPAINREARARRSFDGVVASYIRELAESEISGAGSPRATETTRTPAPPRRA
jgi:hypothetical protein